ncbi:sensor histidine kinase [Actinocorallia longicatena]|uniref:histidine kinase n=1 Tax=Actinocorallia longicatena TaxID=111803 RepID=A0ABP6QQV5_9ACTN
MTALRPPLLQRVRAWQWVLLDAVAALAITVPLLRDGAPWLTVLCWATGAVLVLRRRWPLAVLVASAAGTAVLSIAGTAYRGYPPFVVMLALYTCVVTRGRRAALALSAAFCATGYAVTYGQQAEFDGENVLAPVVLTLIPLLIGDSVRQRREYTEGRVELERRESEAALTEERMRIARELHDVVAHALSMITVQAGVARHKRLPEDDLLATLGSIEHTGRSGLVEMRRLLGVLRDGRDGGTAPQPGLDLAEELVEAAAAAGLTVSFQIDGERRPLSPGADLTAYRLLQEALTNVVRHGRTPRCRVCLAYSPDGLCLRITNPYREPPEEGPPGHGLRGMAERVRMFDGTLSAGPADGSWTVEAWIPDAESP